MTRTNRRHPARNPRLWASAALVVIVLAALIWHFKSRSVTARYAEMHAVLQSPLAEHYARQDRREAPLARLLLAHFGNLDWYAKANRSLPPATPDRVVLYGDSIFEFWPIVGPQPDFAGHATLDRGVRGQPTPELLWRFRQDALDLHPGTIVLLGGANDILLRSRDIALPETERNLQTMVEAAQQQHIRVIFCLLTPIFTGEPDRHRKLTREIRALNDWIRHYAAAQHLTIVDFFDALAGPAGTMRPELTNDGIHPNAAGYALMLPLAQKAIDSSQ